jgi:inhibitor of KinA sporulation pathway (predicted exonuclease)
MDDILVIDLEATCWEDRQAQSQQPSEIIEIGWCHIHYKHFWDVKESGSILVKPRYSIVSDFCTRLTGHTQKHLEDFGMTLEEAAKELTMIGECYGFNTNRVVWSSWGMYDYRMLKAEMSSFFPLSHLHLNAKALFSTIYRCKGLGLRTALERVGMKFEGLQHRGINDAVNTAKLLIHLIS